MEEKILLEITNYCESCPCHEKCVEQECVLFRIEKLIEEETKDERNNN